MRSNYLIFFIGLLGLLPVKPAFAQQGDVDAYIDQYKMLAMREMVRTGVPAAISLAQGIVESGAGSSWLSLHANNQFGIKCKSDWAGPRVFHHDDRRNECFRKYASVAASWEDHSDFLKSSQRYSFLFFLDPLDYKAWAYGLKQAGYATSNRYARQLIATIQKYDLNKYSRQGLALSKEEQPENEFAALLNKKIQQEQPEENEPAPAKEKIQPGEAKYPVNVFQINKRDVLFLPEGTELISVAHEFDVPLRRLLRYNGLQTDVLPRGMLVFVEKKRKKGDHAAHVVQAGETWREIAQEEGIRLKWLLKRNHLTGDRPPQPGTALVLRGYAAEEEAAQTHKSGGFFAWLSGLFSAKDKKNTAAAATAEPSDMASENLRLEKKVTHATDSKRNATFVYEVKSGDTLYGISQRFNVGVDSIRQLNNLSGDLIKKGQKLQIPEK